MGRAIGVLNGLSLGKNKDGRITGSCEENEQKDGDILKDSGNDNDKQCCGAVAGLFCWSRSQ